MCASDVIENNDAPPRPATNIELASHVRLIAVTDDLVAVNKPAGFHSAPLRSDEHSTMLNAVATLYPEVASPGGLKAVEGLLLHRLDRGTSGTLLFARSPSAFTALRRLWKQRTLEKDYLAWVPGRLIVEGTLALSLTHSPKSKKRMVVLEALGPAARRDAEGGRVLPSLTTVLPLHHLRSSAHHKEGATLVLLRLHSGVMHQARVVLAALGHPVCEDPLYTGAKALDSKALQAALAAAKSVSSGRNAIRASGLTEAALRRAEPRPELLPEHGFFLHAYRVAAPAKALKAAEGLNADTLTHLKEGLVSPPPIWFGIG